MRANVVILKSELSGDRDVFQITRRRRICTLAPKTNLPVICLVNGVPVLRKKGGWKRCIEDGDTVAFVIRPLGKGGGSIILKVVLMLALAAAAIASAGTLSPLLFGAGATLFGVSAVTMTAGVIFAAGSMAINALIGSPKPPSPLRMQAQTAPSPTYNLGAQGNRARLGEAIPEIFGRHLIFPDLAAEPYTEFAGNEQYLYQLFAIGRGEYDFEDLRIEDTAITSFPEVTYELLAPGEPVTLFPVNVVNAGEVAGQELLTNETIGPFIVNPAGSQINVISVDIVCPKGLFYGNNDGSLSSRSISCSVEIRSIDNDGVATGNWQAVTESNTHYYSNYWSRGYTPFLPPGSPWIQTGYGSANPNDHYSGQHTGSIIWVGSFPYQEKWRWMPFGADPHPTREYVVTVPPIQITDATATPIRRTYKFAVTPGRYEVRMTRTDTKDTSTRVAHDIMWTGLKGFIPSSQSYPDVTMLAMRLRATNSLSSQSARKVNLIAKRKLPIWGGTSWGPPTHTRSIAWALAYICKTRLADSHYDLDWLLAKDATWTARGDNFDAIFDAEMTFGEALSATARAGRAKWFQHGMMVRFFRDEPASMPVALFNMRNTVRGSFKTDYLMSGDETADSVIVEYFDETTWTPKEVLCQLPGHSADKPARLKLFGVINRDHAWREGMYEAATNRYRRMLPSLTTEMEGFIPLPGDLVALQRDRPGWGQSGDVMAYDPVTKTLTLSEPLVWTTGTHYFGFRKRDGSLSSPWSATAGADDHQAVLDLALDFTPDTGNTRERTSYAFGPSSSFYQQARVISLRPRSMERVELLFVNEDSAVHVADTGSAPTPSAVWNLPAKITRPVVNGLNVTLGGTAATPMLLVSWIPSPGADHYYVEWSYNNGTSWNRAGTASAPNAAIPAQRGAVRIRVAGVGIAVGNWSEWSGDPFAAPPPDVSLFLISIQADGTRQFDMAMPGTPPPDFAGYAIRYRLGTGWTDYWGELDPLHTGLLTASPYETNQLAAGAYTFAVKGFDDSGNESENAVFITSELPDPRMAGIITMVEPHLLGWPGTKTNCAVEPETNVLAATDTEAWADLTTWDAYTRWVLTPNGSTTYEHVAIDVGISLPFTPLVSAMGDGAQTIEEQHSDDNVSYSAWAAVGPVITARYVKIRITLAGTFPRLSQLTIKLSGEPITEIINDLDTSTLTGAYRIGVGDIRLPMVKAYSVIRQASVMALQNVGPGWSWVLIDKDTAVGPRIKIYNASNALADAIIDANIQGS
ncbi:host specificity factor TipJ family phage tail protein [Nitrosovibrio sp. Nv6]|uniref:host specificity factor TipJ family phage tail protein n=1 Tax=Nitrosovibrio sp. Nv6 TaxID=1855340 RepID=UPI0008AF58EC|nr:host specificity factor TipJ family phage tail protein [Nitrosovibrio sp. Nv6]SEO64564.1 Putative phage tail protein [Nitrosovibrio sp. Nv6]